MFYDMKGGYSFMSNERYYSAAEIGQRFGVKPDTVRKWVREGKLERGVRFSAKCTRWPESVVLAFEASLSEGQGVA
jgi:transposase-like protein